MEGDSTLSDIDAICLAARSAALALAPLSRMRRGTARSPPWRTRLTGTQESDSGSERASDVAAAEPLVASGEMSEPLLRRLELNERKVAQIAEGVRAVAELPDPLGVARMATLLDEELTLRRVTCPLGVVAAVFESRPDALVQDRLALPQIRKRRHPEGGARGRAHEPPDVRSF